MIPALVLFATLIFVGWSAAYHAKQTELKRSNNRIKAYQTQYQGAKGETEAIRKKHKQLEIEMETLKKRLKHLFETRETAERQAHEAMERLISLMFSQSFRCAKCGRFIKTGMANWDMKELMPYCTEHFTLNEKPDAPEEVSDES